MRRKLLFWAMMGILVIGKTGCIMKTYDEKEKMLAYMENRYGEEFIYIESYAGQYGKEYVAALVKSRKHPEREALVRRSGRNGRKCYEDNYLAYLLKDALEEAIKREAEQSIGECEVVYVIPGFVFPDSFSCSMSADTFLKEICAMPQFMIYPLAERPIVAGSSSGKVPGNISLQERQSWEEKIEVFRQRLVQKQYKIRGSLYFADGEELAFSLGDKGRFRYLRWFK